MFSWLQDSYYDRYYDRSSSRFEDTDSFDRRFPPIPPRDLGPPPPPSLRTREFLPPPALGTRRELPSLSSLRPTSLRDSFERSSDYNMFSRRSPPTQTTTSSRFR